MDKVLPVLPVLVVPTWLYRLSPIFFIVFPIALIFQFTDSTKTVAMRVMASLNIYILSIFLAYFALSLLNLLSLSLREDLLSRFIIISAWAFGFTLILGMYINQFSGTIYPEIPNNYGGGMPTKARFLFKPDMADSAKLINIPLNPNSFLSSSLVLLFETENTYVIKLQNGQIIMFDKDIVSAIEVSTN